MKDLDFRLAAVEYSGLGLDWAATTEEFKKAEDEVTELHATLARIEAAIEESRADALAAEHQLSSLQHKLHETETALGRAEHKIELSRSQIASLNEQRTRDQADREYLIQETARVSELKARYEEEAALLAAWVDERNVIFGARTGHLESLSQALQEKEQSLEEARAGILSAMTASAAEKGKITNLQTRISQIEEQDARGRVEKNAVEGRLRELTTPAGPSLRPRRARGRSTA